MLVPAVVPAVVPIPEVVLLEDDLPAGAAAEGTWVWDAANFTSGKRSHGHPPAKGLQSHGFSFQKMVPVTVKEMITQQVWLDPANPPKGISLQMKLSSAEEVGVYWEAEEEVFKPQESQELWYYGPLPELGKWITLEVLAEGLGLEEGQIAGFRFVTYGGRVLWDRTLLTAAPPLEEPKNLSGPTDVRPGFGKNRKVSSNQVFVRST